MRTKSMIAVSVAGLIAVGCASTPKIGTVEFSKPVRIQSFPDSKPSWAVNSEVQYEKGDYKYFVGSRKGNGVDNESVAETLATNNATENILIALAHDASWLVSTGLSGAHSEKTGEVARKAVVQGAALVKVWGLNKMETYNEEMGILDNFNQKQTYWNSWVLLKLRKSDYDGMIAKALNNGIDIAQREKNADAAAAIEEVKAMREKALAGQR